MAEPYKVVLVSDLVDLPSFWQLSGPEAKKQQFARSLEDALNRQAAEGWSYVASHVGPGSAYLIFRRTGTEGSSPNPPRE